MPNKVIETVYLQYLIDILKQELAIDELAEGGKINKLIDVVSEFPNTYLREKRDKF